jgi:hypothetical protein
MNLSCLVVRSVAPSIGRGMLSKRLDDHVGACLSCQAELARYGKLRRYVAALADVVVAAPASVVPIVAREIVSAEPAVTTERPYAMRTAAAGAVAAAAAGAVAVALWRQSRTAVS